MDNENQRRSGIYHCALTFFTASETKLGRKRNSQLAITRPSETGLGEKCNVRPPIARPSEAALREKRYVRPPIKVFILLFTKSKRPQKFLLHFFQKVDAFYKKQNPKRNGVKGKTLRPPALSTPKRSGVKGKTLRPSAHKSFYFAFYKKQTPSKVFAPLFSKSGCFLQKAEPQAKRR